MNRFKLFGLALLCSSLSLSGAQTVFPMLPNLSALDADEAARGTVGLGVRQAQAVLSARSVDLTSPWPCSGSRLLAGTLPAGTTFAALLKQLTLQGFSVKLRKPQAALLTEHQINWLISFTPQLGGSLLVGCPLVGNWKPPLPPPLPASAPRLGTLSAQVAGWSGGRASVRAAAAGSDGVVKLIARGQLDPAGQLRLDLPRPPDPATLRPLSALLDRASGTPTCAGRQWTDPLRVSAGTRFVLIDSLEVLNTPFPARASKVQLLQVPSRNVLLNTSVTARGQSRVVLVYTTAPVKLGGVQRCEDTQITREVHLNLPGGWSAFEVFTATGGGVQVRQGAAGSVRAWQVPLPAPLPMQDAPGDVGASVTGERPAAVPSPAPGAAPDPNAP